MRALRKSLIGVLLIFMGLTVNAQVEQIPFYIRGTGGNHHGNRTLQIGNHVVYFTGGRGLRLTVLQKSDFTVVTDQTYDTYGSTVESDNLAAQLDLINQNQIGVLTSNDAWEFAITPTLNSAFLRLGLTKAAATTKGTRRRSYAAVFEGAGAGEQSAKAVEVSFMNTANQPFADIRGYFSEASFVASGTLPNALVRPQGNGTEVIVDYYGNVGVGIVDPKHKLDVDGTIRAKEIKVSLTNGPDFVFEEDYQLKSLEEVEQFVKERKHLPGIASAKKMEEEGVGLAEMNKLLLQKIEELTLYNIQQNKKIKHLEEKINNLLESRKD
ncbi:hypothetical protein EYV94_21595 [Puteibacter caeruleilacunae]|nr:hypothetical protein EYV94_21595 [Puteibacter caeruleilacunae]